jgi:hypothetical protein
MLGESASSPGLDKMDNDIENGAVASQESAFEDDEAFEFDLDMSRADTKVWLVKVNKWLAHDNV